MTNGLDTPALNTATDPFNLFDEELYNEKQASLFLDFQPTTLRNSRCSGKLAGVDAPPFYKIGKSVKYLGRTLKGWRAQFKERSKSQQPHFDGETSEEPMKKQSSLNQEIESKRSACNSTGVQENE
jgi:hypothetical protein